MHSKMNSSKLFAIIDATIPLKVVGKPARNDEAMNGMQNEIAEEIDVLSRINLNDSWPYFSLIPIL